MRKRLGIIAGIVFLAAAASAQTAVPAAPEFPPTGTPGAVVSRTIEFPSKILNETRRLLVSLPKGYDRSSEAYPVLYLMDGAQQIEMVGALARALSDQGAVIPELIVVGIANTDRERDLTFEKSAPGAPMPTAGGAANFLKMIREEIVPLIEGRFRTAPFRILHGHSLGGYVASRTFLNDPRAFNAYIAVSSSLQMENFHWLDDVEKKLRDGDNAKTFFQLTLGNEGYRTDAAFEAAWTKFTAALGAEKKPHYAWASRRHLDDNHGSIPIISTYEGLRAIFADYSFENAHEWEFEKYNLGRIQEHYRELSEKYGFPMAMPLPTVLRIGQQALKQGPIEEAAAFIEEQMKLRPGAPMLYLLKAGVFQAKKDMAQAMALIEKAREMATPDERVSIDSIVRYALTPKK
jgi:uncharacterized protein